MYSNAGNYKCISKLQYFQKRMKVYCKRDKEYAKIGRKRGITGKKNPRCMACTGEYTI